MTNILNKLESVQTNQTNDLNISKFYKSAKLKLMKLQHVNRKWTTCLCDIYMQEGKGTTKGKNGIITKNMTVKCTKTILYI